MPLNESLVVSPISVIFALAMVQAGAKGNTKSQISSVISAGSSDSEFEDHYAQLYGKLQNASEGVKTQIVNELFVDKPYAVKKDYEQKVKKKYDAMVQALDFSKANEVAEAVNGFVSKHTGGKINDIVRNDSIDGTYSIIVNAIYFAANWRYRFYKGATVKETFYSDEENGREIQFMRVFREYLLYAEDDELQVLSLEYIDRSYAFNIFLPKTRFGLSEVRWKLTGVRVEKLLSELDHVYISVTIPKMKIETNLELRETLVTMGITDIFSKHADLTGIVETPQLQVSQVAHKAVIEVDEDGTTAAAATVFKVKFKSLSTAVPIDFRADHPFLFVLTKDKNPLFMGQFV